MGEPVSSASPHIAAHAPVAMRRLRVLAWISALSATLLVLGELVALDAGLAWSLTSAFDFGTTATWIIAGAGAIGAVAVSAAMFRTALANELALAEPPVTDS
jgi:hypothetical protein